MALPNEPRFTQLIEVTPEDVSGLRLLSQPGSDPRAPQLADYRRAFREIVAVDPGIIGGISAMIAQGGACCLTLANPSAPWQKYLADDNVIIRPLPAQYGHAITYLCWRVDRDTEDDLGLIIKLARTQFGPPLAL